ncbi:hypothetical protein BJ322DRAFT_361017 [Thelephora terrestris]|uniref:C2H2-type domain-containing protein n=1 Tax=Thelephora terrestris TaxID=56493 RepID=A0A9P6H726_9AGAM|nr:hypothetical protein BJ322DRAFT_361017 [Thelephora terrestris]
MVKQDRNIRCAVCGKKYADLVAAQKHAKAHIGQTRNQVSPSLSVRTVPIRAHRRPSNPVRLKPVKPVPVKEPHIGRRAVGQPSTTASKVQPKPNGPTNMHCRWCPHLGRFETFTQFNKKNPPDNLQVLEMSSCDALGKHVECWLYLISHSRFCSTLPKHLQNAHGVRHRRSAMRRLCTKVCKDQPFLGGSPVEWWDVCLHFRV